MNKVEVLLTPENISNKQYALFKYQGKGRSVLLVNLFCSRIRCDLKLKDGISCSLLCQRDLLYGISSGFLKTAAAYLCWVLQFYIQKSFSLTSSKIC